MQTNIKMIQLSDIIEYIKEYVINVSHDVEELVVKNLDIRFFITRMYGMDSNIQKRETKVS